MTKTNTTSQALPEQASRAAILSHLSSTGPQDPEQIFKGLGLPPSTHDAVLGRIRKMVREKVISLEHGRFSSRQAPFQAIFQGKGKGGGFIRPTGAREDATVDRNVTATAFQGDIVEAVIIGHDDQNRPTAAVCRVLERNPMAWVGEVEQRNGRSYLHSFDKRRPDLVLETSPETGPDLADGMVVSARLNLSGDRPTLGVDAVLALELGPKNASTITRAELDLPGAFPQAVLDEVGMLPDSPTAPYPDRFDVRQMPLVTIDGASSRDFDDAVHAASLPDGGFELHVAIADVSAYVPAGSALDLEARRRGTSVYLPDSVIPMLPEALSNGLCSLNPGVDRLCLVCVMTLNEKGEVTRAAFKRAVMHSHARLTYDNATARMKELDAGDRMVDTVDLNLSVLSRLQHLLDLRQGVRREDRPEYRFRVSGDGHVVASLGEERTFAHRVIESCMIMANVAAAEALHGRQQGVFRVHEQPQEVRYEALRATMDAFGIPLPPRESLDRQSYQTLMDDVRQHPEAARLVPLAQRLPSPARYGADNGGHFSLGLAAYTHFTSPIRRYPDLLVHRALLGEDLGADLDAVLVSCNELERRASLAERQVSDRWKCAWLSGKTEEVMTGFVSGIRANGMWVTVANGVEGFLPARSLPDGPHGFDAVRHEIIGQGQSWTLGQKVDVHVKAVSLGDRRIDWGFGPVLRPNARPRR